MNARPLALLFSLIAALPLGAADKAAEPTYLTPEDAPPDFKLQGEYSGDGLGAQVIALGDAKFRAVFYDGGLPGAGWDGKKKVEIDGAADGDKAKFEGQGWGATVSGGKLTGKSENGKAIDLTKTERQSPTLGAKPLPGAVVLFDGTNTDAWNGAHTDEQRHLLAAGTKTKQAFGDFSLHAEFFLPFKPTARGQGRGNSGVYLQDRYEVQVLDSFGLKGVDNECGGLYKTAAPKVNMCFPPLQWQTYDIDFQAARYDAEGKKTHNAVVTVRHNGVVIQENVELPGPTGGGKKETPESGPIQLQGHGNPVFYKNVWILEKK